MKKNLFMWVVALLMLNLSSALKAQACPTAATTTLTATTTANTCAGNGTLTATFSPSGSASNVSVQLIKSGVILQSIVNTASPYVFTNLQPGNDYQVRLVCSTDNGTILKTINATVADNYVTMTDATVGASNVCGSFSPGGTINVTAVNGGTPPYQYSAILNSSTGYPDNLSVYGNSSSIPVTQFGTYQIRVKDACNNYYTEPYVLEPSLPRTQWFWKPNPICGDATHAIGSNWYSWNPDTNSGGYIDNHPLGLNIEVHTGSYTGPIIYSGNIANSNDTFTYTIDPSHIYYVISTNACGLSTQYTVNLANPTNNPEFFSFVPVATSTGCGAAEKMGITGVFSSFSYWNYPLTVTLTNSGGTQVGTPQTINDVNGSFSFTNLPLGNYYVTVTDTCGHTLTKPVDNVQNAGAPNLYLYTTLGWRCGDLTPITQNNTTQAMVGITGYIPDREHAVVTITSGPSNVGVNGTYIDGQYWGWSNLLAGTYQVSYTSCGVSHTGSFTIDPTDGNILHQSFTATATSLCGGTGSINSVIQYNGNHNFIVELFNSAGGLVDSNNTGNFNNLPAGTYTVKMTVKPWCNNGAYNYVVDQPVTLTIAGANAGATVTSSVGVICEDASGNPLTTGSAYLDIAGVAPFTVNYGTSATGPWTTINNAGNKVVLNGLAANTLYYLQITDNCGVLINSTVQIKTMGNLSQSNTVHPCNGSAYALTIPYYSGATYEWTNPQGVVVSNTRTYSVASWDNSYNGTYIAKIKWSNCVTRFVNVNVNSNLCGQPITSACYKDPVTTGGIPSKHGITSLGRAGNKVDQDNWPMVRESAHTVLESKTKGFVINRVATDAAGQVPTSVIATPVEGMLIYDTTNNCVKAYDGTSWKCLTTQSCPD